VIVDYIWKIIFLSWVRKQEWFAPRMQRWHKENLIPYVQGERIYADDFYLLHVAEDKM